MAVFEYTAGSSILAAIITILIVTLFVFLAAKFVLGRTSFFAALGTAVVGTLLAQLAATGMDILVDAAWLTIAVWIIVWALIAAIFFRAAWVQGAIIGLVAWVLHFLVSWAMSALFG